MLIRTGGLTATLDNDFHWRWSQTPEERLLAQAANEQAELAAARAATSSSTSPGAKTEADWPGFRGANRDGIVHGLRIATDWSASPPAEMWRRPIGPGWSSFAVSGDLLYTQEQRGPDEVVACYTVTTGKPVWKHSDKARFWESNGGSGPRGTPTLSNGRVYTLGATGILNVLKADDGSVVWSRNAVSDTKSKLPMWGFSGSPLVVGDLVSRRHGGQNGRLRFEQRRASLGGPGRRRWLQLATTIYYPGSAADSVAGRKGRDQRRGKRRQGALAVSVDAWRPHRAAGPDRRGRRAGP